MDGPISLTVKFIFHDVRMTADFRWKTTKPDTDNMIKLVKDCMTRLGFWYDDAQVCRELVEKFFSRDVEGIYIELDTMESD
jgi:Holliday junction resolvase RusA-like endonuclease